MSPLFFTLNNDGHLLIIPDTQAHLNGHEEFTLTYSTYADQQDGSPFLAQRKESALHLAEDPYPDYYSYYSAKY